MEFQRQCRRLNNYKITNHEQFKTRLETISTIASFKSIIKPPHPIKDKEKEREYMSNPQNILNRLVIADNNTKSIHIINEADGQIVKSITHDKWETYGVAVTNKIGNNFIYFTDCTNDIIRKYDENLNELKKISPSDDSPLNCPCGIAVNNEFERIDVIDQKNHRAVSFDIKTDEFVSEFALYKDIYARKKKKAEIELLLKGKTPQEGQTKNIYLNRKLIDCWPFGIFTRNERIFVTDWAKNYIYVYKNGQLENKIKHPSFMRIRDIVLDSLDSILVTDIHRKSIFVFDNKGVFLLETKLPIESKTSGNQEESIYGVCKIDNTKLIMTTSNSIYTFNLNP